MSEQLPDPRKNPKPTKPDIPVGKLVSGKPDRAGTNRPKPRPEPTAPVARPAAAPSTPDDDYDVELVAIPYQPPRPPRDQRSLIDLDRRDFIMLGAGIGGSILAVLSGLLLAKAFRRKPPGNLTPTDAE